MFWNKVAQEKSEFKINSAIPYIFNTPMSIALGFNLYRQDSTFLNTRFNLDTQYEFNTRSKASISYSSEKSSYLLTTAENNFGSYSNYFIGIGYQLRSLSNTNLFRNNYSIALSSKLGKRKNEISDQTQVQLEILASLNIQTNKKSYINIKAASKLLKLRELPH